MPVTITTPDTTHTVNLPPDELEQLAELIQLLNGCCKIEVQS